MTSAKQPIKKTTNKKTAGNRTGERTPPGRPLQFRSVAELRRKIDAYFKKQDETGKPYTINGIALKLNVTRSTLHRYESNEKFCDVIKWAKARCEERAEESILDGKGGAGAIFWLKNQGWSDKQEIEVNDITELTKDELIKRIQDSLKKGPVALKKKAA